MDCSWKLGAWERDLELKSGDKVPSNTWNGIDNALGRFAVVCLGGQAFIHLRSENFG